MTAWQPSLEERALNLRNWWDVTNFITRKFNQKDVLPRVMEQLADEEEPVGANHPHGSFQAPLSDQRPTHHSTPKNSEDYW